jgi:hypothetical protein
MSLLSFVKEAGEKLIDLLTPGNANASEQLKEHISKVGLGNPNVQATVDGDKVTVTGEVASQEEGKICWRWVTSKAWAVLMIRSR